jgi:tripartite motif-containing protein 71
LRHGRAAALLGSLAMVLAVFGLGLTASAGAEELSHAEKEKLPVIVQWAFRNGAATNPLGCGEGCAALWTAEHSAMPNGPAAQEIWDQLGAFEASEGLWPSLSTLATDLSYAGIGFEVGPFTLGWHVGGPSGKWMKFQEQGAATTPQYGWCGTAGSYFEELAAPGEAYGTSPESGLPAQPKASGWTYIGRQHYCYYGGIGYYAEVAVPTCNESISPPTPWPGWSNPSEAYATCGGIKYLTALRTRPFHYAAPEEYTSQTAYDVVTNSAPEPAPSVEAVEAALKAALEASGSGPFNAWVRYVTTGEGSNPTTVPLPSEEFGAGNPGEPGRTIACAGKPVNCATGNEIDTQTDISVPGRGVPLELSRTYNSQAAVAEGSPGPFGYGWSSSFSDHLTINTETSTVTVDQANGSTVAFTGSLGTPGPLTAPAWAQSTLVHNSDGTYLYTLPDQEAFHFDSSGRLTSVADRNGNTTTLSYSSGHLEAITDPAGRTITLAYNEEGRVESATDPMGHITKYGYESGKLVSVTQPGGTSPRWQFKYDSSHQLTEVIDGRGGATVNEYGSSHRVSAQTDPAGRKLSFEYQEETVPYQTTITNHATGAVTTESFDGAHELISITHGYGTTEATTETSTYDHEGELASHTDGNGHTTTYTYDTAGNRTSNTDPLGDKTSWTYDATHDVETTTKPSGEVTTITRNTHGEPETISRPAPGSKTQTTKYAYNSYGELTTVEDPLKRVWGYEYDANGDRTAETDPEGDKRTWSYNEDSQETATVSPRGNVLGGEPATFTTTIARDAQGRPTAINEPGGGGSGSPANKSAASITGGAQEGQTLTANTGIWTGAAPLTYTYQWRHCNGSGESCTSITGATGATYALSHGDVGDTIRVVVTATNALGFASSTSAATATVSVPVPAYVSKFGTHGSGAGELGGAKGIALDGKGDFVVSDEGNARVDLFKENGEFVKMFGSYGSGAGQFGEIKGIAVDSKGDIWVADQGNSRISEFNEKGEYLKAVGSAGTGAGQFKEVKGVAIDGHDNVWVADTGNSRIEKFNEKGEFVATYGWGVSNGEEKAETCTSSCRAGNAGTGHGQFTKPRTLAADSGGNIWITDTGNTRVEELNEKGEYVRVFGTSGSGNGQFNEPIGITVDSHSNVWVTDAGNSRVQEFNEQGEYDTQFGAAGSGNGQLNEPWSVRVSSHGEIFVSDSANYRIQTFAPSSVEVPLTPVYVSKFGTHGSGAGELGGAKGIALDGKGDFVVSDEGNARVDVFKENGEFVKMFGSYGSGAGQFGEIKGIAVDSKGDIWVADQGNSRISEFNEKGEYLKAIGSAGTGAGQFKEVKGVAIDVHNNVWVADTGNNRVEKFNEKGEFVATYGWGVSNGEEKAETCTSSCRAGNTGTGHGQFAKPRTLAADSAGNIWITDTGNTRVEELNEKGEYLRVFGSTGSSNGQFYEPIGITVDSHSNVWVTDAGNSRVQEFNEKGEYDTQFGAAGSSNGQLNEPWSVRVNSHGEIFVSDSANYRIQTFAPTGSPESTTTPTISGELLSGQTLRASSGNWKGAATITYTYQWEDCNTSGESCAAIPGATGSAHLLAAGDIGHTLRVVISATNPAGTLTSTSGATEVVAAARTTKYAYDANGNLETQTDPEGNKTTYTYDADNEPTKTETPNKAAIETGYDGAGQVTSQTDGNKHTTTYARNVLEEVAEVTDPLGHKTTKHYDFAGNLTSLTDPAKRTTSYAYDEDSRLLTIRYSAETTPTVKYEYDKDGNRTTQHDGTGTSSYTYDQLDRLTETKDGHGDTTSYEYDLANEQTKITYPNGKAVTRSYDSNGRLKSVTDWLEHTTKFGYDAGSNLTATIFPSATGDEDTYKYDEADQASEIKMTKGTEALASLAYTRNRDGEITEAASKGLPGEEKPAYVYDENSRITKAAGSTYKYDAANNATQIAGSTYAYNSADELETGPSLTYTYDEIGQRTKTTPSGGAATSYGYDQAGNLTSVERPKEGEAAAIKDTYAYNGDGLRTSQAISGTVGYLAWDTAESLPLVLNDGTNSYIYGPANVPVEQINNSTSTVEYLHHDQAGSTRLLTGSTGTVTGKCTYGAYGTPTCEGTATTPLGYDSQYTNSDTGLVYLRARQYDPATAQFTSVDPLAPITREPYAYAENDPLNVGDPTGLFSIGEIPLIGGGLEKVATRYVGFWDGFTQPLFGGTAALRSTLGLNGGLNQCSSEYQIANQIGGYTLDAEAVAPVAFGGVMVAGLAVRGLGASEGEVLTSNLFSQIASSLPDAVLARLRAAMFTLAGTAGVGYSEVQGLQAVAPAKSGSSTCGCS